MHTYGRTWGSDKMTFDLSASSVSRSYSAGDVVEGKLGFVLIPNSRSAYWGKDSAFASRLSSYSTAWGGVDHEYKDNRNMSVSMLSGTMVDNYPLKIIANNNSPVCADFSVAAGGDGIGHIPVILQDVNAGNELGVQILHDSEWNWLSEFSDVRISANNYYQGVMNANGKMDYCFNIARPLDNQTDSMRVRVLIRGAAN